MCRLGDQDHLHNSGLSTYTRFTSGGCDFVSAILQGNTQEVTSCYVRYSTRRGKTVFVKY